jgi:hypothetical protein
MHVRTRRGNSLPFSPREASRIAYRLRASRLRNGQTIFLHVASRRIFKHNKLSSARLGRYGRDIINMSETCASEGSEGPEARVKGGRH